MTVRALAAMPTARFREGVGADWPGPETRRPSAGDWTQLGLRHGSVFKRSLPRRYRAQYGRWVVYLIGPEANRFVYVTNRNDFSHEGGWGPQIGPLMGRGLLNTDGPEHDQARSLLNPSFAGRRVSAYIPTINEVIRERIEAWIRAGEIDLDDECRRITFAAVAKALMGFDDDDEIDELRLRFQELMKGGQSEDEMSDAEWARRVAPHRERIDELLIRTIDRRRSLDGQDALTVLARSPALSTEQVIGHAHILLAAGHETTTTLATWVLHTIYQRPEVLASILPEASGAEVTIERIRSAYALARVVDEVSRMWTPTGVVPRRAVRDTEFGGYTIPAGTPVLLCIAGGHRLPSAFPQPDEFAPTRFDAPRGKRDTPYAFVPFGAGPRVCIGLHFAQVEVKSLALQAVAKVGLDVRPDDHPRHVYFGDSATLVGGVKATVRPIARSPTG